MRCTGGCQTKNIVEVSEVLRYWSVEADWDGAMPVAGGNAIVQPGWNMIYDIESTNAVDYNIVEIHGRLSFNKSENGDKHYELKAKQIEVYPGELLIGDVTEPYQDKATITILGSANEQSFAYNNNVIAGNKILFVANKFVAHGKDLTNGDPTHVKLLAPAAKGASTITLQTGLNWNAGDRIAIASTSYDYTTTEEATI